MLTEMRRSLIISFIAFLFFALAYVGFQQIVDPREPFTAAAQGHPDLAFTFSLAVYSADVALLAFVLGGVLILGVALRQAFALRQRAILLRFGVVALLVVLFVVATLVLRWANLLTGNQNGLFQLLYFGALFLVLLACTILIAQIVLRSEFSAGLLRLTLGLMIFTALAMLLSFIGMFIWLLRLWAEAPALAAQYGLGPGLTGGMGGSVGIAIALVLIAAAICAIAIVSVRSLRTRVATPA